MTKNGLIQALAAKLPHLPQKDVGVVVNTMFEAMSQTLVDGGRIEIRGFGSFSVRQRRARQGRNPKTGEALSVPPKRMPFFTVGNELNEHINGRPVSGTKSRSKAADADSSHELATVAGPASVRERN